MWCRCVNNVWKFNWFMKVLFTWFNLKMKFNNNKKGKYITHPPNERTKQEQQITMSRVDVCGWGRVWRRERNKLDKWGRWIRVKQGFLIFFFNWDNNRYERENVGVREMKEKGLRGMREVSKGFGVSFLVLRMKNI